MSCTLIKIDEELGHVKHTHARYKSYMKIYAHEKNEVFWSHDILTGWGEMSKKIYENSIYDYCCKFYLNNAYFSVAYANFSMLK